MEELREQDRLGSWNRGGVVKLRSEVRKDLA